MSKFLSFLAAVIYMWYIANGEELHNLKELQWRDSHVAEFECPDGHDYCAEMEFCSKGPILGYRTEMGGECSTPGPVIRVKPGYRYHLTLRNAVGSPTNIHTHGMFISGSGNGDDVTRSASPGQCLHYSWIVPESHMGGTHWYHSHVHGKTSEQVSAGALGMIIVEDVVSPLLQNVSPSSRPGISEWLNQDLALILQHTSKTFLANGVQTESLLLKRNQWYRLRILLTNPTGSGGDITISSASACEIYDIAYDGVYTTSVPGVQRNSGIIPLLTGASRLDVAIQCQQPVDFRYGEAMARIVLVDGEAPDIVPTPFAGNREKWVPQRPSYLLDLTRYRPSKVDEVKMTASSVSGYSWNPDVFMDTIALNSVVEWTISSSSSHPLHLHMFHMQVMRDCGPYITGQYYDTISTSNKCVVRFMPQTHSGRCVLHCHHLGHEDKGAMTQLMITGPPSSLQSSTSPAAAAATCEEWSSFRR